MDEKPLAEFTTKELQAELVKLGMPEEDTQKFNTKAALIATINVLKATKVVNKVDTLEPPVNPKEEKESEKHWQSKADRMAKSLESQPKVRVLIPLEPQEKQGVVREMEIRGLKQYVYVSGAVWSKTFNLFCQYSNTPAINGVLTE